MFPPSPPHKHKLWPREPLSVLGAGEAAPRAPGDLGTPVLGAEAALRSRPRRAPGTESTRWVLGHAEIPRNRLLAPWSWRTATCIRPPAFWPR